ncbi:MAG TPA: PIN domain-containing protein [Candidatus Hydrogenedentes bacterium]|nr:PIN domain-containing protein [Candidatus Hydrogenedentota bacterium]HNT89334.1 PIN domain-containing protein [Candidatus Hydrogenedentota bacterium]
MFVVDTNILLYAADRDAAGYDTCRKLVTAWRKQAAPWYLTWGIVYEFLRVATHPNVFRKPFAPADAWRFLWAILASPTLGMLAETDRHGETLAGLLRDVPAIRGNLVFDAHTVALMREHGIKTIYTHDADFHRFPGLHVVDPL